MRFIEAALASAKTELAGVEAEVAGTRASLRRTEEEKEQTRSALDTGRRQLVELRVRRGDGGRGGKGARSVLRVTGDGRGREGGGLEEGGQDAAG